MTESALGKTASIPPEWLACLLATRQNAYAPYSRHAVAALVVTGTGQSFFSCNVESAHYKSICAEAGAISAMVTAGESRIREVWVLGPGPDHCPPCGDCRQRIHEFADEQTRIHLINDDGRVLKSYGLPELLPEAFGGP
jgi:cytidine deaminase